MAEDGHGAVHGRFTIPALQAAMLKKVLLGLAAPKHQNATGGTEAGAAGRPEPKPSAERLGRAFCEYIERYPSTGSPTPAGPRRRWW